MKRFFRSDLADKEPPVTKVPVRKRMMCLNESYLDPYQTIKEHFLRRMENIHLNRYLSPITNDLHQKLADYVGYGLTPENLVWGNGADDILYHIFLSVRENSASHAVCLAPSYFDYKTFCIAVGLGIRFLDLNSDFSFDTDRYLEMASHPDCRLAILCNPNNPTGNLFSQEKLRRIIQSLPNKLVLVDETYYEFSGRTFAPELRQHPNLILTRSFSKAFSCAGLRFGYAVSSAENIYELRKVFTTFHTSILNQAFAATILENIPLFRSQVQNIITVRNEMFAALSSLPGIKVYPSHTNFLTFTIGEQTSKLFDYLKENDIAVRDVSVHPLLRHCLRATMSSNEDNQALFYAVKTFLENSPSQV